MRAASNSVWFSALFLGAGLLMLSCASSSAADHLTVHLPAHHSNVLHVDTCVPQAAADEIHADEQGKGKTSLCPGARHTVDLEIVEGQQHYQIPATAVHVRRTGDGIATSVEAPLAQR